MAAEKGNQYAIGNSGSSKKWESPEDLQSAIDEYFKHCDTNKKTIATKSGDIVEIPHPIPYTIEGLCELLECERQTLLNYSKQEGYEEYFDTIKKAKSKIAKNKVERGLMGDSNPTVTIFDLKNNHGYKDKTEVSQTVTDLTPPKIKYYDPEIKENSDTEAPPNFDYDNDK